MIEWSGKRNTEATSSRRGSDSQMRLRHTKQTPPPSPALLLPSLFTLLVKSREGGVKGPSEQGTGGDREIGEDESTSAVALIRRGLSVIMTAHDCDGRTERMDGWIKGPTTEWLGLGNFFPSLAARRVVDLTLPPSLSSPIAVTGSLARSDLDHFLADCR